MVRAGAVGTHLPASGLDIFGDLRKMNKRQVREARQGGAPGSENRLRLRGVGAFWVGLRQGQRLATGAAGARRLPHRLSEALGSNLRKPTCGHRCALSCTDKSAARGGWPGRRREYESSPTDVKCG